MHADIRSRRCVTECVPEKTTHQNRVWPVTTRCRWVARSLETGAAERWKATRVLHGMAALEVSANMTDSDAGRDAGTADAESPQRSHNCTQHPGEQPEWRASTWPETAGVSGYRTLGRTTGKAVYVVAFTRESPRGSPAARRLLNRLQSVKPVARLTATAGRRWLPDVG